MTSKATIRRLMDFVRLHPRLEPNKPIFSHFLGLKVAKTDDDIRAPVRADRFSFNEQQQLVFRYRFPDDNRFAQLQTNEPSLSTYTSILDELTTYAVAAAPKNNPRPGISVTMSSQWGLAASRSAPEEVDIVTTITKRGRTLAFVRAEVRDPKDHGVICFHEHVKYLPLGRVFSWILSPFGTWCLNLFLKYLAPYFSKFQKAKPEIDYDPNILETYEQTSETTATFRFGAKHCNPLGGFHGGMQTILMEKLGTAVAQTELQRVLGSKNAVFAECQSLSVSYQSSASRVLELQAHVLDPPRADSPSVKLRIEILRKNTSSRKVVVSEGILTFGMASSKKDQ